MPTSRLKVVAVYQPAVVTGDVEAILGRPATPFAERAVIMRDLFNSN